MLSYQLVDTVAGSLNAGESWTKWPPEHFAQLEELGETTGSDDFGEVASLICQLEIRSQPDKEHSLGELLTMLAEEDMVPPAEPSSLEAEAGDQADEP